MYFVFSTDWPNVVKEFRRSPSPKTPGRDKGEMKDKTDEVGTNDVTSVLISDRSLGTD